MEALHPFLAYINGRSVALLGLGVSHTSLAQLLWEAGVSLTVYDKKPLSQLREEAQALIRNGIPFVSGEDCFEAIPEELILRSPGIRPDLPALIEARSRGAEVTSEIALLLRLTDAPVFGITGSDGKTTSTTLTGLFLQEEAKKQTDGQVWVGGNIGTPLLPVCHTIAPHHSVVLELSSFQLMDCPLSPRFSALTNLTPNHMDWHRESMEEYASAKRRIIGPQTERLVTNAENPAAAEIGRQTAESGRAEVCLFSSRRTCAEEFLTQFSSVCTFLYCRADQIYAWKNGVEAPLLSAKVIRLPGQHNLENVMTAVGLTLGRVSPSVYERVLSDFCGVEHRLEWIRRLNGVDYYNSSIDSTPTRTAAALSALAGRDLTVICGGYDKKIPFEPLAEALCRYAHAVVLTGATAPKIKDAILRCPSYTPERLTVAEAPDLVGAVGVAQALARTGGCVLLSPACASFDAFRDFRERGALFCNTVRSLH